MAEKLSITLPSEMVAAIRKRVDSGRYASTSDVLREAMGAWLRDDEEQAERLTALRSKVTRSLADRRPAVPMEEAFARLSRDTDNSALLSR